jgi:hypothetical protein
VNRAKRCIIASDAIRKLVHVCFAEQDGSGGKQGRHDRGMVNRVMIAKRGRSGGGGCVRCIDIVFHQNRQSVKRSQPLGSTLFVRGSRRFQDLSLVLPDECV